MHKHTLGSNFRLAERGVGDRESWSVTAVSASGVRFWSRICRASARAIASTYAAPPIRSMIPFMFACIMTPGRRGNYSYMLPGQLLTIGRCASRALGCASSLGMLQVGI